MRIDVRRGRHADRGIPWSKVRARRRPWPSETGVSSSSWFSFEMSGVGTRDAACGRTLRKARMGVVRRICPLGHSPSMHEHPSSHARRHGPRQDGHEREERASVGVKALEYGVARAAHRTPISTAPSPGSAKPGDTHNPGVRPDDRRPAVRATCRTNTVEPVGLLIPKSSHDALTMSVLP